MHSGSRLLYTSYALFADTEREMRVYRVPQSVDYRRLLGENVIGCSTVLLHRSLLERLRFRGDVFHEDYALWLAILRSGDSAAGCTEVLADWRISEQSRSFDKRAAAVNRWRIYRDVERLSLPRSAGAFFTYALHGVRKHGRI